MATKRKTPKKAARKPASKPAPRKRPLARRRPLLDAPLPASAKAAASTTSAAPRRNGLILIGAVVVLIAAVFLRSCREESLDSGSISHEQAIAQASAQAKMLAKEPTPDAGRRVAPAAVATAANANAPRVDAARRARAGETGESSLDFDRSKQGALMVRCWRPAGGHATLDVFGPRNQHVRSLKSEEGAAGWQSLPWDGKDEAGKKVSEGLYYLRPSGQELQQVRDVWVKG